MKYSLPRFIRAAALLLVSGLCLALPAQSQTLVRLNTTQGVIDFRLLDTEAPVTVNNFLAYVLGGDYTNVFFHRSIPSFVIQSGGFRWPPPPDSIVAVTSRGAIVNEFSVTRSNIRGTVAMAKTSVGPNTATSQWFINMNNNAANLDNQNGGFTVFARVTTPGMVIADRIAALPIVAADSPFDNLPVTVLPTNGQIQRETTIRILAAARLPASAAAHDRIFNYIEADYTSYFAAFPTGAGEGSGYTGRYYGETGAYLLVKDGSVYYYNPRVEVTVPIYIATVDQVLAVAAAAGY